MDELLAGRIFTYAAFSALLAVPVTLVLLWLFKRSVVTGMKKTGAEGAPSPSAAQRPAQPSDTPAPTLGQADRSLAGALVVYVLGCAGATAVFTAATSIQADGHNIYQLIFLFAGYSMPILFAGLLVLPKGRARAAFVVGYLAIWAVFTLVPLLRTSGVSMNEVLFTVAVPTIPAALLIALFMTRRFRAAGPLVLMIVTASVLGWNSMIDAAETMPWMFGAFIAVVSVVGFTGLSALVFLLGSVIGVAVMWPLLKAVGLMHRKKLLSDQSLVMDVMVLWFCVFYGIEVGAGAPLWMLSGIAAFAAYKGVSFLGFGLLDRARARHAPADLLLLRPFALGVHSQRLFDQLSKVWLRIGAIHMIAGPDLVTATVAPSEFLTFLSGRLSRRFVNNHDDLVRHLAELDLEPDPDRRYRINQLFCRDNIWRDAMRSLAGLSRVTLVLMDLRGFSQANEGCAYEIGELLRNVPLDRIVFAVDGTTDQNYVNWLVQQIWPTLGPDSPNYGNVDVASRAVWVDNSSHGRRNLLRTLMASAA